MRRRFVARRRNEILIIRIIAIIIVYLAFILIIRPLFRLQLNFQNEYLLSVGSNNVLGRPVFNNSLSLPLTNPEVLLSLNIADFDLTPPVINAQSVIAPQPEEEVLPLVYIYNTHPNENFYSGSLAIHNITPNVIMASYMLQTALAEHGIISIVEEENVNDILRANGWRFAQSYQVSRKLMERAKEEHPSIRYFIDVHRDSYSSRITIDGTTYARIMFVIGRNHENYQANEKLMKEIHEELDRSRPGIMRRLFYGQNSRFNQDISENVMLIEIGGPRNTIDEVHNSVNVFAESFAKVIGGD